MEFPHFRFSFQHVSEEFNHVFAHEVFFQIFFSFFCRSGTRPRGLSSVLVFSGKQLPHLRPWQVPHAGRPAFVSDPGSPRQSGKKRFNALIQ
jgi:hypothetical protein